MVVYYLGNPAEKKKRLTEKKDGVYLNNDEVLAVYGKNKRYYFVTGEATFLDFTVWEYLSYAKSLEVRRPLKLDEIKELLIRVGLKINASKKLSRFDVITQKAIRLSALIKHDTAKIYLNFDGMRFSRRRLEGLKKLLAALSCYETVVSVSDKRFVPSGASVQWFFGEETKLYKTKVIKKGKKAIKVF